MVDAGLGASAAQSWQQPQNENELMSQGSRADGTVPSSIRERNPQSLERKPNFRKNPPVGALDLQREKQRQT